MRTRPDNVLNQSLIGSNRVVGGDHDNNDDGLPGADEGIADGLSGDQAGSQLQNETDAADGKVHIDEENDQYKEAQDLMISAKMYATTTEPQTIVYDNPLSPDETPFLMTLYHFHLCFLKLFYLLKAKKNNSHQHNFHHQHKQVHQR